VGGAWEESSFNSSGKLQERFGVEWEEVVKIVAELVDNTAVEGGYVEDEETGLIIWLKDSYGFLGLKGDGKGSLPLHLHAQETYHSS
jgi:hypothetical protein